MIIHTMGFDKYTFFWNGPHSQWAESPIEIDGIKYNCCEQYMMAQKARVFNDSIAFIGIMHTDSPKRQKELGRTIRNFNPEIWNAVARDIVFRGNLAKYSQNEEYGNILLKTDGTLLVEASPFDRVWGIGMDAEFAATVTPDKWDGTNWLGQCITEVRIALYDT